MQHTKANKPKYATNAGRAGRTNAGGRAGGRAGGLILERVNFSTSTWFSDKVDLESGRDPNLLYPRA